MIYNLFLIYFCIGNLKLFDFESKSSEKESKNLLMGACLKVDWQLSPLLFGFCWLLRYFKLAACTSAMKHIMLEGKCTFSISHWQMRSCIIGKLHRPVENNDRLN